MPLTEEEKQKGYLSFENEVVDPTTPSVVRRYSAQPTVYTPTPVQTPLGGQNLDSGGLLGFDQFSQQRGGNVDEAAIRESTRKGMQAAIDATNTYYDDLIRRENQAGDARLSKVRAINVNSGLSGSNFATSADLTQRDKNAGAVRAVEAERNLKTQEIFGRIDEVARGEIAAKKAEALGNANAYTEYLAKAKEQANSTLTQLAGANVDLNQLDENRRSYLFKLAGYDNEIGALVYNSLKPKPAQLDYKYIEQADGSTLAIAPDPNNPGKFVEHRIEGVGADIGLVLAMANQYKDAGILPTDDIATATGKIQKSRIYRKDTYIAPSGSTPVPQAGEDPQLYVGLTAPTATAVRQQVSQFKTEPTVQNFATIQEGYNFASSIADTTNNPADDQALIYSLAKALDPGSVVREGEYATAQKYAQSWVSAYGKGVEQALFGTGFLSEQARKNIKATIEQKFKASKLSYDNLSKQYSSDISTLTGRGDGQKFLRDYAITSDYTNERAQLQPGEILVKDTQGNVGAIPEGEFDASKYTKL